jgi:hypothetical protein
MGYKALLSNIEARKSQATKNDIYHLDDTVF